ncbi:MAG: helix-turn-helix domain-containing protein [Schaedlerella sp.]
MICAYDRLYLDKARISMGRMLDFAVHELKYNIELFFQMFIESGTAGRFERGDSATIAGKSGVETAYDVIDYIVRSQGKEKWEVRMEVSCPMERSPEYWAGWALAYYQWRTGLGYQEINTYVPIQEIVRMYHPYHEMDIQQFCDRMNELLRARKEETNLKRYRMDAGMSQRELAEASGVPLRTIQQYEQRQKNMNHASISTVAALGRALVCPPEKLLEADAVWEHIR